MFFSTFITSQNNFFLRDFACESFLFLFFSTDITDMMMIRWDKLNGHFLHQHQHYLEDNMPCLNVSSHNKKGCFLHNKLGLFIQKGSSLVMESTKKLTHIVCSFLWMLVRRVSEILEFEFERLSCSESLLRMFESSKCQNFISF